jgi:hypothetical protein
MRRSTLQSLILFAAVFSLIAIRVGAYPEFARKTKAACASCHASPAGGAALNQAGKAFQSDAKKAPAGSAGIEYVGSQRCKMCHPTQHKAWSGTDHAHALETLHHADEAEIALFTKRLKVQIKGRPDQEDACVKCHVTGFKLGGGYPAADSTKNAALSVVGCESCHGPGARHVIAPLADKKKFITKNLTEKLCRSCHTPATSPDFEFEKYQAKGVHAVKTEG